MTEKTVSQTISPADGWVRATSGENSGSIHHINGGVLRVTQASTLPGDLAPEMATLSNVDKDFVYFGLGSDADYLYVRADKSGVKFSVTPANE